ncbi:Pentalenene oxygenase [Actinomadura rubteroloni]|uniref:Pentalenene oxygenase n=1 Tax=Actinomadura rubteroloni TaxID=1926885 RepID=A0A2P4UKN2_9ACTN|nr:cytochrome P450 [Actinomadura rubteroloni]POM25615.1 Pentalenene oxygenase [Actinomadura rubteroloni]
MPMTSALSRRAGEIPFRDIAPTFARDPLAALERIGARAGGEIVRLRLGAMNPYLVTRPEHVEHVLSDNAANYGREGWLWNPLSRLVGEPAGDLWWSWRAVLRELVSGPSIDRFADEMAVTIVRAVDEMAERGAGGTRLIARREMSRIVFRAITRVLVGDMLTTRQSLRLGESMTAATAALRPRLLAPFVPNAVPFFGDRTFGRALREIDDLVFPIVREARERGDRSAGHDVVSRLLRATTEDGDRFTVRQLRDSLVSLYVGATETTVIALTFLWVVLGREDDVRERLTEEIDRVVGSGRLNGSHLRELTYTKQVALETLRLYPPGWMLPRVIGRDDVIDGVRIDGGGLIVVSPYLTHRLPDVWPEPTRFDPGRFRPGHEPRHRLAYLTFGAGPHGCVGRSFFIAEMQLVLAALLSRFRVEVHGDPTARPKLGMTLRPRDEVEISLVPRAGRESPPARS